MEQTINNVNITGVLVKNGLEKKEGQKGEFIGGSLILRTDDKSEHEIRYIANKYKKDKEGNVTDEESGLYKGLETVIDEYKSLENNPEDPDVIKIGLGNFDVQDYMGKQDGLLKTFTNVSARFANRISGEDLETNPKVATFEVEGIITNIVDELKKEIATGNKEIHLDIIGYKGKIIPIKLIVPAKIAPAFMAAGFFPTGAGKFSGKIINTKTVETKTEHQAFGEDIVKQVTTTLRLYEVTGGTPKTMEDIKISNEEYETAKSKRRLKLQELKNKAGNQQNGFTPNPAVQAPASMTANNPFAQGSQNPFMQK